MFKKKVELSILKISRLWFSGLYFDKHELFKDAGFQIGRYVHLELKSCHLTRPTTKKQDILTSDGLHQVAFTEK